MIVVAQGKDEEIQGLYAQLKEFESLRDSLQSQLLQKDEKFGKLLEEKDGETARALEAQQAKFQADNEEKATKLKKLESQHENTAQL